MYNILQFLDMIDEEKKINEDKDFQFLHFYLQKGFALQYLLNLTIEEKQFMTASMEQSLEDKNELWERLSA